MADLVSLACPSCGGQLKVSKSATLLTCQFCGTEHMVKHETGGAIMLEAYARCPVCGRNDRAEKVSAVIASQSHELSGVEQKTETVTNAQGQRVNVVRDVPYTRKQVSLLGQRLTEPVPPDPSRFAPFPTPPRTGARSTGLKVVVFGVLAILVSIFLLGILLVSFLGLVDLYPDPSSQAIYEMVFALLGVASFPVGGGLVGLGIYLLSKAKQKDLARTNLY